MAFGTLTGDLHPLHFDREWAAESPFGERIAHGLLVLAYALGLVPLGGDRMIAMRRLREVTFSRPVRIGDTIRVRCRVSGLTPIDERRGVVASRWEILNPAGEVAVRADVELVWRR